jgi:hypothetical protein
MASPTTLRLPGALLLLVTLELIAPSIGAAATIDAANCSSAAVQAAIDQASDGDTVTIPAGTCSWSSGVTIKGKGIKLKGGGSGRIIGRSESLLPVLGGTRVFTTTSGLNIVPGQILRISQLGDRSNFVQGPVISYAGVVLTIDATITGGSGSPKLWLISTLPTTVITNDSPGSVIDVEEDNSHHVEISDIKIADGTGSGRRIVVNKNTAGGKAVLTHDCWMEAGSGEALYWTDSNRGVIWNCSFDSSPFSLAELAIHHPPIVETDSWSRPSTMGAADTTGENNLYIEDSDFHAFLHATDFDSNARAVMRHVIFDNAAIGTHGPDTGPFGQRHFEVYDSQFIFNGFSDGSTFPLNHWFFIRGGTFVVTDNILPIINSSDYPNKPVFDITVMNLQRDAGPNPCWGADKAGAQYPSPRQPGFGFVSGTGKDGEQRSIDAITYVGDSEPMYMWNNTSNGQIDVRMSDFDSAECSAPDETSAYVQAGRDYFLNAGPKPGYVKFVYPHPLRRGSGRPAPPTNLRVVR